jgi:ATP-dependent Clp protease ATP-binding subunit ClpC
MFNLKEAKIFQAVRWERNPIFRFARIKKKLFLVLFFITFLAFLYGFLAENFSQNLNSKLLGLSIIFLVFSLSCFLKESFFNLKLAKPKIGTNLTAAIENPEKYNLAEFLSFKTAKAIWQAIEFSQEKKLSQIPSEALFYFSLESREEINFIFSRLLLNLREIKEELKNYLKNLEGKEFHEVLSPDSQKVILEAAKFAKESGREIIKIEDIIISQSKIDPIFRRHLISADIKTEDIENLTWWLEDLEKRIKARQRFWEWENLLKKGSLAKEWAAGYTLTLDRFSIDLSNTVKRAGFPEMIGHQEEIEAMERILARREANNSVLIIGESGSGRKSMIYALAKNSLLGESLPEVNFKRVVQLDLPTLLAQIESPEEIESILDTIFREIISAGNVILVIDEFHNFVGSLGLARPGTIDISGVISPYLPFPSFQVIAITTFEGLHKNIEQNPSILALFEKVEVSEISQRETLMLLEDLALKLERRFKKFISYLALRDIISFCDKYIPAIPFPEKAMDLLEEIVVYVSQTRDKIVLPSHVAKIVSEKIKIPVGEIEIKEREILLNLENLIHQRIINQEEAVKEVSAALKRARAQVIIRKGPIGSFLFLGPTGVGKTETSKALAEIYFGSEERMIRLDMSEFQDVKDIPRLIGSPGQEGLLTTQVREKPFSLILLDEVEKTHPNILNLFLQVLDEGHLTDGLGRKIGFKNTIIIATSNAGYQIILEALKEKTEWQQVKEKLLNYCFEKAIFRPEFINRFDAVVVFGPLSKKNLLDIAQLLLQKLKKNLAEKEIEFIITQPLKEKIVELSYDPTFGARNIQRVIQDKLGNVLAEAILSGELKRGYKVEIEPEEFKLKINP